LILTTFFLLLGTDGQGFSKLSFIIRQKTALFQATCSLWIEILVTCYYTKSALCNCRYWKLLFITFTST